jgi:hypothetical protein
LIAASGASIVVDMSTRVVYTRIPGAGIHVVAVIIDVAAAWNRQILASAQVVITDITGTRVVIIAVHRVARLARIVDTGLDAVAQRVVLAVAIPEATAWDGVMHTGIFAGIAGIGRTDVAVVAGWCLTRVTLFIRPTELDPVAESAVVAVRVGCTTRAGCEIDLILSAGIVRTIDHDPVVYVGMKGKAQDAGIRSTSTIVAGDIQPCLPRRCLWTTTCITRIHVGLEGYT